MKVNTKARKGKFYKSAKVYTNDPQQPKTKVSISCVVKEYITVKPSIRINLTGFEGERLKKKVTISSSENQPFEITDILCDNKDKIKYKLKTVKKGREYTLKVSNRSTEEGNFRGKIELKTTNPKKPQITLHVYGMLKREVDIRPKTLSFGTINTTEGNFDTKKLTKRVVLVDNRGKGLTIKKVKPSNDWITTGTETKKKGKNYVILITLDKDKLPKGPFNERIEVRTNYKRKFLVVDLKGKVI